MPHLQALDQDYLDKKKLKQSYIWSEPSLWSDVKFRNWGYSITQYPKENEDRVVIKIYWAEDEKITN